MYESIKISCVIPVYNRQDVITKALESVFSQTRVPDEIIVVDDGSTDQTRDICLKYGKKVRVITQENTGASSARNKGAQLTKYEWVAWLDSDDTWTPDYLKNVCRAICKTDGKAELYFSNMEVDSSVYRRQLWGNLALDFNNEDYVMVPDAAETRYNNNFMAMLQASVMKKTSYFDLGGLHEDLAIHEDTLLFLKYFLSKPVCAVNQVGAIMGLDADNRLSKSHKMKSYKSRIQMWEIFRQELPTLSKKWIKKSYHGQARASRRATLYLLKCKNFTEAVKYFALSIKMQLKSL